MTDAVQLRPPPPLDATVRPPGSKSLSNRALLMAAMASGDSVLGGLLDADDTRLMRTCLRQLGVEISDHDGRTTIAGHGAALGRRSPATSPLEVGTAGTVARFLTAALVGTGAAATVDGSARMRERPMAALLTALRERGAVIECKALADALPLRLEERGEPLRGGELVLTRPRSSQFVSALLIAATLADAPTVIRLPDGTPARPYVDMTLSVLTRFGAVARWAGGDLRVEPGPLRGTTLAIEPDASAASYFLALSTIWGGTCTIEGLGHTSEQGDAAFCHVLEQFGAQVEQTATSTRATGTGTIRGVELDLAAMPDMTLTAAVVALFADGPTTIDGVAILRHHESDRLAAGAAELRKLGAEVEEREGGLHIVPPRHPHSGVTVETYEDHRMAMAFSMAGDVRVADPGCVAKTFPRYFDELARLGMRG